MNSPQSLAYQRYPHYQRRKEAEMAAASTDFSYKHDTAEDSTFQLVDTTKTVQRGGRGGGRGRMQGRGGRYGNNKPAAREDASKLGETIKGKKLGGRFGTKNANRGWNPRRDTRKVERLPSLSIGSDWDMIEEFDLVQLLKLVANPPQVEDLVWAGHLDQYNDSYDGLTTRTQRILKRIENKVFYDVTTSEDPIMERFAVENAGDVYATDAIIAQLMAAPRSVYSWDIVIEKVNGQVFMDKRDNSSFDFLSVSETSLEPPVATGDDVEEYNTPDKLSLEATMINQNFSQQVLHEVTGERKSYEPNPFFDEDESGVEPASAAYRYRKFTMGTSTLIVRTELHCWHNKKGVEQLMTCHAINEWDSKFSGGVNWRQKIDQQKGAVLATELKNNSCKIAKWTAQALLSGAAQMKLGYVSRSAPTNPYEHAVLATQYFKPKDLASQINLSINNIWGIIKMLTELLLKKPDGKYVLLKDPNKGIMRLYAIPIDSFEEEEEEEEEEGEEGAEAAAAAAPDAANATPEAK
jgi:translation initiation factor 3 subunit D